jgi:signal transduction histidine kinase
LNNPIHNIQSCLEAAQRKIAKSNKSREFIDLAYEEVLRMGKLIRQMLDFYRPQVNPRQKIDVGRVIQEVLKTSERAIKDKGIAISHALNNDVIDLSTTADQLKQVFLNLLLNALDAMPNGGSLKVATCKDSRNLSIVFEDTGCGIAPQYVNKIFDAFFTTKARASGVGLGLTVSYGIVRSLGGNILVASEVNKGSRFTVQLPIS